MEPDAGSQGAAVRFRDLSPEPGLGNRRARVRHAKKQRVHNGTAHAALVYDGEDCVGWCQFGSTDQLPRIKWRRAYESVEVRVPDWRITCFFVDKE